MRATPIADRLYRQLKSDPETGCLVWTGALNQKGYASISSGGSNRRWLKAHRVAWELVNGPIPEGLQIDHLCRNRACCNPDHLEPVTCKENLHRGLRTNAAKTHCPQGHPYDEANTLVWRGQRHCRTCQRARKRRPAA